VLVISSFYTGKNVFSLIAGPAVPTNNSGFPRFADSAPINPWT
jgi:hypothetical protein